MLQGNKETFLSLNHQILTVDGWADIETIQPGERLISFQNNKFIESKVVSTAKFYYTGKALILDDDIKLIGFFSISEEQFKPILDFTLERCIFEGELHSIKTTTNSIIARYEGLSYVNLICVS